MKSLSLFFDITKIANFLQKMLMSVELRGITSYGSSLVEAYLCQVSSSWDMYNKF